jgi:ribosome-binding protein aMBF1 (putative translation factor)
MSRTAYHYRQQFADAETVGRKMVALAIYAAQHGDATDADRKTIAELMRAIPYEVIPQAEAMQRLAAHDIGTAIWLRRTHAAMSQGDLAEALDGNPDQGRISQYESGKREPTLSQMRRIAAVLGPFTIGVNDADT